MKQRDRRKYRRKLWQPEKKPKAPEYSKPDVQRILVCWNDYWTAGALWRRKDGVWGCVTAEERLGWMKGKSPEQAKLELARLGCEWKWQK